jgi:hypothetical protein
MSMASALQQYRTVSSSIPPSSALNIVVVAPIPSSGKLHPTLVDAHSSGYNNIKEKNVVPKFLWEKRNNIMDFCRNKKMLEK